MGRSVAAAVVLSALTGFQASGQFVISARAGLIHYAEGRVFVNQTALIGRFGLFPRIKENDLFYTGRGRAEILLSPGVFLRLAPETSIRLLSGEITDPRIELVSGEVVLEAVNLKQVDQVTLTLGKITISTDKKGQYHVAANPPDLRVFSGMAVASSDERRLEVKKGREVLLAEVFTEREFNPFDTNALDKWSDRRSQMLARVNDEILMKAPRPTFGPDYQGADKQISALDVDQRTRQSDRRDGDGKHR